MRFTPYGRADTFAWTSRKLANAAKRGDRIAKKTQDNYPLLADQFDKPAQFDADREASRRDQLTRTGETHMRTFQARVWRDSRRDMQAATPAQKDAIRIAWLAWRGPTTAGYFRYVVDLHTGVVDQRAAAHRARQAALRAEWLRVVNQQTRFLLEAA